MEAAQEKTTSSLEKLRRDFNEFSEALGLDMKTKQACFTFLMEKNKDAWISGKEFGWRKAWAWKKNPVGKPAPAA